ncbi:Sporulation kinase E [Polystyrenella longa]|uniref:histidine kinase n=1 Tax=Polystyrenella longa TaxID=2528007 RepID=A0A518CGY0_9PLAN|nr:ATP-binding protein [Polystyrenella longa]QDU78482.1 Sporulation kinase E [Polystyrenella longa]
MSPVVNAANSSEATTGRPFFKQATVLILSPRTAEQIRIKTWLQSSQVEVLLSAQLSEVREQIVAHHIDLLVIDDHSNEDHQATAGLALQLIEGIEALQLIERIESVQRWKIPFVVLTNNVNTETAVEVMKRGALDYLVKDDRLEDRLRSAAQRALANSRANQILSNLEGELNQFEQRTRLILDTAAEAFVSIDGDGTIVDWNVSAEKIFGFQTQEIVGKNITETIVPERYRQQVAEALLLFKKSPRLSESLRKFESTALKKDGHEVPITLSLNVVELETTHLIAGFACDISKRCDLESQLIQSEKMASLGHLAAGVAHEINNPVGFVTSNVATLVEYIEVFKEVITLQTEALEGVGSADDSLLSAQLKKIEQYKQKEDYEYLKGDIDDLISESTEGLIRVKEIVQNLKTFARVDDAETKEANINDCLDATLKVIWNEIKYNCELVQNYGDLPPLRCYPGQLNHVFMNLLVNAAHAIQERGTIVVTTKADDKQILVSIRDDGHGIEPEHLPQLFTPFFTTKPVGKGTGLGLSIAYGIIQKHKGMIDVKTEIGKGTTFTVELPFEGVEG